MIILPESACLGRLSGPYFFVLSGENSSAPVSLKYVKDLFFIRTTAQGDNTLSYLRNTYGIQYSRIEPTAHYNCPDAGRDIALVRGVQRAALFARQHPDIAESERARMLNQFVSLYDAMEYVAKARAESRIIRSSSVNSESMSSGSSQLNVEGMEYPLMVG